MPRQPVHRHTINPKTGACIYCSALARRIETVDLLRNIEEDTWTSE